MIECADPELILQLVGILLHRNSLSFAFRVFSEFEVPRIGTGSEVGLCVDAAEKMDKKANLVHFFEIFIQTEIEHDRAMVEHDRTTIEHYKQ